MTPRAPRAASLIVVVTCLGMLAACTLNPATGQRQLTLISEAQEIEMGRRAEPQVLASFGELRNRRCLEVEPARVKIVELSRAMSFSDFAQRYPSNANADKVAILNGVGEGQTLKKDRLMKRIVGGDLPEN